MGQLILSLKISLINTSVSNCLANWSQKSVRSQSHRVNESQVQRSIRRMAISRQLDPLNKDDRLSKLPPLINLFTEFQVSNNSKTTETWRCILKNKKDLTILKRKAVQITLIIQSRAAVFKLLRMKMSWLVKWWKLVLSVIQIRRLLSARMT